MRRRELLRSCGEGPAQVLQSKLEQLSGSRHGNQTVVQVHRRAAPVASLPSIRVVQKRSQRARVVLAGLVVAAAVATVVAISGGDSSDTRPRCGTNDPDTDWGVGVWPTGCWRPYADDSPFNQRLPSDPRLDPRSDADRGPLRRGWRAVRPPGRDRRHEQRLPAPHLLVREGRPRVRDHLHARVRPLRGGGDARADPRPGPPRRGLGPAPHRRGPGLRLGVRLLGGELQAEGRRRAERGLRGTHQNRRRRSRLQLHGRPLRKPGRDHPGSGAGARPHRPCPLRDRRLRLGPARVPGAGHGRPVLRPHRRPQRGHPPPARHVRRRDQRARRPPLEAGDPPGDGPVRHVRRRHRRITVGPRVRVRLHVHELPPRGPDRGHRPPRRDRPRARTAITSMWPRTSTGRVACAWWTRA